MLVHHRRRKGGSLYGHRAFAVPLVLYLPPQEAEVEEQDLTASGKYSVEYVVRETAGEARRAQSWVAVSVLGRGMAL